jgi:ubiquinone/menaquinone biosynthesis C-methylase UbiE
MSTSLSGTEGLQVARPGFTQTIRRAAYRAYWRLERVVTPGLRSSQYVFAERLADVMKDEPVWLDLGCGRRPFPEWMSEHARRVVSRARHAVGIDLDLDSLRDHTAYRDKLMATAEALPFPSGTFDIVSANMVVEHVEDPVRMLREVRRVLKPGGAFVFHTSNRRHWPLVLAARVPERLKLAMVSLLEARKADDVFPTHYRINDEERVRVLAAKAGFRIERLEQLSSSAVTVVLGPVVLAELLWIRLIRQARLAHLRSNLIVVLRKE